MHAPFDAIAAFVQVVEQGSFTAAAERLAVSTSVVSKRVRALESHLETALLRRTTRRVELTEAGRLLYSRVSGLPARIADAEEQVRALAGEPTGELRVILPSYFASPSLYRTVVPRYLRAHPAVRLTLTIVSRPAEHMSEDYDILLMGKLPHQRFPDASLIRRRLLKFHGALFASPGYLERHGRPAHPRDLDGHNCLSYLTREWHFTEPGGESFVLRPTGNLTTNSNEALLAATVGGLGIAYSFPVFFAEPQRTGKVVRLLDEFTSDSYVDMHAFYRRTRFRPQRVRAFLDALTEHFSAPG